MNSSDDPGPTYADRMVKALLESEAMDETKSYLERGRQLAAVDAGVLRERWTAAFKQFFKSRTASDCQAFDDINAELGLRNLDRPWETVKEELAMAQAEASRDGTANPGIRSKIAAFLDELDRDTN